MPLTALAILGLATAAIGTIGGIGGAVLLVPVLVLGGIPPSQAAPLGLLVIAAGSLAASASQIEDGLVHHRLGVTLETAASVGAFVGAGASAVLGSASLARILAVIALAAAVAGFVRRHHAEPQPAGAFVLETVGEWPGTLGGLYREHQEPVPYEARNVPLGLAASGLAGLVAGVSGTGGGFIKTPTMCDLMGVPLKVASATTTFTVGLTAAAALVVHAALGHIDYLRGAAVVAGALVGGRVGAVLQQRMPARASRLVLSSLLAVVAVVLLVRGA